MADKKPVRGYLASALTCRCPRCREGKLFKNPVSIRLSKNTEMHERCAVCNQPTEIEVGFYYGTGYVSYATTVAISVASFVAWFVIIGMSTNDNRFFYWLAFNAVLLLLLQPWLMRLSRSLWISWFVNTTPTGRRTARFTCRRSNQIITMHNKTSS
ncbi:MAG: DUF983 domain-containing protein [Chitinophagaceae bacterium]|nr:DUF983 domain-containing protein [Chitinophagaceae bacterium]